MDAQPTRRGLAYVDAGRKVGKGLAHCGNVELLPAFDLVMRRAATAT